MAIRLRTINGRWVALCATETDPAEGDVYLDDNQDRAIRAKLALDHQQDMWAESTWPDYWALMETQKRRDAQEDLRQWAKNQTL